MKDLRAPGVRLALDDFGTGYSSLSYLQRFLFDTLKVDRSFVHRLEASADTRAIVNADIGMSYNLGIDVTAEGVENEAQLDLLLAYGCNAFQGFLLGRRLAQGRGRTVPTQPHLATAGCRLMVQGLAVG